MMYRASLPLAGYGSCEGLHCVCCGKYVVQQGDAMLCISCDINGMVRSPCALKCVGICSLCFIMHHYVPLTFGESVGTEVGDIYYNPVCMSCRGPFIKGKKAEAIVGARLGDCVPKKYYENNGTGRYYETAQGESLVPDLFREGMPYDSEGLSSGRDFDVAMFTDEDFSDLLLLDEGGSGLLGDGL